MSKSAFALFVALIVAFAGGAWYAYGVIEQQRIALQIWQNCPLPQPGTMLVVEADWPGQEPGDQYRCSVGIKRTKLPPKLGRRLSTS